MRNSSNIDEFGGANVKEILADMKDISEKMLDLAYSAVIYRNREVVNEVLRLEERMDALLYNLRVAAILGARNLQDAVELAGIIQIASAAENISNAAADIAKTALSVDITCYFDMEDLEEGVIHVRVSPKSELRGKTLGELKLETETGMRILAIKRGDEWIYSPDKDEVLMENDLLIASGPTDCIPSFYKMVACAEYEASTRRSRRMIYEEITDKIAEMKNISELMVGLAYSAVTFQSKEIAEEVAELEERMDRMKDEVEMLVLEAAATSGKKRFNELRGVLHVCFSSEVISDAAYEIADIVLRNIPMHPVFVASLHEMDEVVMKAEVKSEEAVGKTIESLGLENKMGMFVLAVRRSSGNWIYNPDENTILHAGDIVIMRGPKESEETVRKLLEG